MIRANKALHRSAPIVAPGELGRLGGKTNVVHDMDPIVAQFTVPAVTSLVVSAVFHVFFRDMLAERIRQQIRVEYDSKLELYKKELEVQFQDQMRRRKIYEGLVDSLEEFFGSDTSKPGENLSLQINKLFSVLALYAPDDVYRACKESLITGSTVFGKDVKPVVYAAIRKSLFGQTTSLQAKDLVDHINATQVPHQS